MSGFHLILAQTDGVRDLLGQPPRGSGGFDATDTLIILAFIFLLAVALFSWAYFIRKRPEERLGARALTRTSHRRSRHAEDRSETRSSHRGRTRRRRRHRSEEHGRRNPTLGETGGLPPPRPEEPEDSGGDDASSSSSAHGKA